MCGNFPALLIACAVIFAIFSVLLCVAYRNLKAKKYTTWSVTTVCWNGLIYTEFLMEGVYLIEVPAV